MTLESQAATAAQDMSAAMGREVACEYLGQRHGPARTPRYRYHPIEWKVRAGQKKSCVSLCFRWSLVGAQDVLLAVTEQRSDHACCHPLVRPGSLAALAAAMPCSLWYGRALEALHKAANDFVEVHNQKLLQEFGLKLQCVYPG